MPDVILFANTSKIAPNIIYDVIYVTLGFQGNATTSDQTVVRRVIMLTDMAREEVGKECLTRKSFPNSDGRMSLKERNPAMFAIKKQKCRMALARYMGIAPKHRNDALQNGTCPPDYLVKGIPAPDNALEIVSDKFNMPLPVERGSPWIIHGVTVGYYRPSSILKTLPGLYELEEIHLQGKRIRQLDNGLFVLSDVAAAVLFDDTQAARRYANNTNQVNSRSAPSLKYMNAGHPSVSVL